MRISISFNFIEIFKPKYAIFRALFITLIDFVSLMSTIFNHEQMVWPSHVITTENENNRSVIGIFYKLLQGRNHVNLAELFLGY